jgi:phosphatidate cytidylyltransferase
VSRSELRDRLLTSLLLIPLFLATIVVGRWLLLAAILSLSAVATGELLTMAIRKGIPARRVLGIVIALAIPLLLYLEGSSGGMVWLVTLSVVGVALVQLFAGGPREALAAVAVTVFGAFYVGFLFGHFVLVREFPRSSPPLPYWTGAVLLSIPIALTWINDTAAYAVGRRWGNRKLMPSVSPGKSLEGALGGLAVTVAAAVPMLWLVDRRVPLFETLDAVAIAVLVSVAGPCGDLVESAFKRDAGVKDVSRLIPGHGGILDRFDSLLFTVPTFYYYFRTAVV